MTWNIFLFPRKAITDSIIILIKLVLVSSALINKQAIIHEQALKNKQVDKYPCPPCSLLMYPNLRSRVLVIGSQGRRRGEEDGTSLKVFTLSNDSQPGTNYSPWLPQPRGYLAGRGDPIMANLSLGLP